MSTETPLTDAVWRDTIGRADDLRYQQSCEFERKVSALSANRLGIDDYHPHLDYTPSSEIGRLKERLAEQRSIVNLALDRSANRTSVPVTGDMMSVGEDELREALRMLNSGRSYQYVAKRVFEAMIKAGPEPAGERVTYTPEQLLDVARNTLLPTQFDKRMAVVDLIQALEKPDTGERPLHPPELKMLNDIRAELGIAKLTAEPAAQAKALCDCADKCEFDLTKLNRICRHKLASAEALSHGARYMENYHIDEEPSAQPSDAQAGDGMCGCTEANHCVPGIKVVIDERRCRVIAGPPFSDEKKPAHGGPVDGASGD